MKTIAEALAEAMALASPLVPVVASLDEAYGRHLAADVIADVEIPWTDVSLVDGFAVRADEIGEGATLPVGIESRAGSDQGRLTPGTAARIFTGAPVPAGADAVVMQEVVHHEAGRARFERAPKRGAGIRPRASDVAAGEALLRAGQRIDAGAIGLCASQGRAEIAVFRAPRVAIVTTGDELRAVSETLSAGALFDSAGPMLAAAIAEAGAVVSIARRVRDDLDETVKAIGDAILVSDLVLTVGGVSVGDHDRVHDALAALGVERKLWKVRMKPGKPLAVGVKDRVPVIGLPGNPVSAWVGFEVFVRPLLRRMSGDPRPFRRVRDLPLGASIRCSRDRVELARARIDDEGVAWPASAQGSSALRSVVGVEALLILPERDGELLFGERVPALLLDGRGSDQPPFVCRPEDA